MAFTISLKSLIVTTVLASLAVVVNTAPLSRRQLGSVQCNIDRLKIVVGLQETSDAVNKLAWQVVDTAAAANVTTAQTGIHGAQLAIDGIANAVFANQTAPPELRDQVGGNFTIAADALTSINATDPALNATVTNALNLLSQASDAGNAVVQDCTA
ncbi:hypothetical protein FA95DRAFT_1682151 [Auriscalpium vulgare]|uniref:Uncharacterized protein n=1 Tax=Auriscalpium vulgare TaxID=40419 RepID=A0ACB8RGC1_9AGAM|nr:hypothetical protein FA95DRAFT_1682151 [Auriscalpium vulgare]